MLFTNSYTIEYYYAGIKIALLLAFTFTAVLVLFY